MAARRIPSSVKQSLSSASREAAYTHVRQIGKGSFGTVALVRCVDDHKLYVMKLVRISTDPAKCQEALREVQVLEALSHPNIVEFKEAFIARDQCNLCIVMAYCESGDLQARIDAAAKDGRPFSEQQAMDWFIQMVLALDYVHKRHILHRDLKPQNVFLTESNKVVKMGDFGVTRMLEHTNAMAQTLIGTPYYMSPELCSSKPYNHKSDVWALGVIMYQLLALRLPFSARDFKQLCNRVTTIQPAPLPTIYSQPLRALVVSMLSKAPAGRPSVRQMLAHPFVRQHLVSFVERYSAAPAAPEGGAIPAAEPPRAAPRAAPCAPAPAAPAPAPPQPSALSGAEQRETLLEQREQCRRRKQQHEQELAAARRQSLALQRQLRKRPEGKAQEEEKVAPAAAAARAQQERSWKLAADSDSDSEAPRGARAAAPASEQAGVAERQRVEQLEQQVERDTAELQRTSMALHRLEAEEGEREAAAQVAQLCATRLSKNPPAVRAASAAGSAVAAARTMRTHDAGEVGGGEVADEVEDNEEEEEEEGGALAMATLRQAEAEEAARDAALMRGERPPAALDEAHDAPPTAELSGAVALADAGRALVLSVDAHTSQEVAEALHQALPPAPTPPPRAARAAPTRPLSGRVSLRPAPAEALRSRSHHSPSRSKAQAHAGAPGAGRPEAARVPAHWPPGIAAADARPISAPSDYIAGVKPRLHARNSPADIGAVPAHAADPVRRRPSSTGLRLRPLGAHPLSPAPGEASIQSTDNPLSSRPPSSSRHPSDASRPLSSGLRGSRASAYSGISGAGGTTSSALSAARALLAGTPSGAVRPDRAVGGDLADYFAQPRERGEEHAAAEASVRPPSRGPLSMRPRSRTNSAGERLPALPRLVPSR